MEPTWKPGLSPHVDISSTTLSDTFRQSVQEALARGSSQQATVAGKAESYVHTHPHSQASLTPPTPEVLIAILVRIGNGQGPINLSRGNSTSPDPLIEALIRLREHGFIPSPDGKGPAVAWRPSQGVSRLGDQSGRFHYRPSDGTATVRTPHEPSAREHAPHPRGSESGRQTRTETPAEERLQEVLEKAIARYQERASETVRDPERPKSPIQPERPETPKAGTQITPPTIDPERAPRPPETIVSPAIKEALNDPRNNTARLLQQILANDPSPSQPQTTQTTGTWRDPTMNPTLNPSLVEVRASVTERLTQLRDALQTTIERSSPQPLTTPERLQNVAQATSQPGDFRAVEPVTHAARPQTTIQHEGRTSGEYPRPTAGHIEPNTFPALRPVGQTREELPPGTTEKAHNLLDALSKATQKLLSLQTLRNIEYAAETSVITAAAAIALGVIGSDLMLKQLLALSKEILSGLRAERAPGEDEEKVAADVEALVKELEMECADRGVETINQPASLVADIPGTVRDDTTGLPLAGIEIDGGPLGITHTNGQGEFIFKNVPVDEGFAIVAKDEHYSFFPCPALGTVSTTTYLTIHGKKV